MDELYIEINGTLTKCFSTETAATWLGKQVSTIRARKYKEHLGAVLVGRQLWWPAEAVKAYRQHDLDRRYK